VVDPLSARTTPELHDAASDRLRGELAEFLRARRAQLTPAAVGLPQTGRRRTAGLRREEVAELAGISTALYTWLEQARPVPVSRHTLDAIATALQLSADERLHVQNLGRPHTPEVEEDVSPELRRMVLSLQSQPAYVLDHVWNIVFENDAARMVFGDSAANRAEQNLLKRVLIVVDISRSLLTDWEAAAEMLVERFQFDFAAHGADARMLALADDLRVSPLFDRVWSTHRVRRYTNSVLRVMHQTAGPLAFEATTYRVLEASGLRLLIFTPSDEPTAACMRGLGAQPQLADRAS